MVKPGLVLADIGTDHAYLPIYLVRTGKVPRAIAVDLNQGPYEGAKAQVESQGLAEKISVRLGDGLEPLAPGEAETVVLAGMGGSTMVGILERRPEVVSRLKQLVLQPMVKAAQIRRWLADHGWRIEDETLVEDGGIIYCIIGAVPGVEEYKDWLTLEIGPVILAKRPPLFSSYVLKLLQDLKKVVQSLEKSRNEEAQAKRAEIMEKIKLLEDVLAK